MKPQFVILQNITSGARFFTGNCKKPTLSAHGEVEYKILGYADTVAEAQRKLYDTNY